MLKRKQPAGRQAASGRKGQMRDQRATRTVETLLPNQPSELAPVV